MDDSIESWLRSMDLEGWTTMLMLIPGTFLFMCLQNILRLARMRWIFDQREARYELVFLGIPLRRGAGPMRKLEEIAVREGPGTTATAVELLWDDRVLHIVRHGRDASADHHGIATRLDAFCRRLFRVE